MQKKDIKKIALGYAGVASAVLGFQKANGQVVYVDINDVTLNLNGDTLDLNIDSDTNDIVDYRFIQFVDTINVSGSFIQARGTAGNQVLGMDYGNYYYPFKLNMGDAIDTNQIFNGVGTSLNWGQLALDVNDTTYPNDQFAGGVTDGFIGIRFGGVVDDTARTFFGWIRVDVASDLKSITIKDYAYQSDYTNGIQAGEGMPGFSINELELEIPKLNQRGRFVDVSLPESFSTSMGELIFTDLSGREVERTTFEGANYTHALEALPKGVLIASVESEGRRASIKVVSY